MPQRILIAEDDSFTMRLMEKYLAARGYEVLKAGNGREAFQMVLEHAPPIVITDWMMPEMCGVELCRALRTQEGVGSVYIVLVTAHSDTERLIEAFEAGADEFLAKPINRQELMARLRAAERILRLEEDLSKRMREIHCLNAEMAMANNKLAAANDKLFCMATTDELTRLMNRREALNRLEQQWSHWQRHGRPFSVIMLDLDAFKRVNDTLGHAAGDHVIEQTARVLRQAVRASDIACRIGGEEFLVICTEADELGGLACAEHIREALAAYEFCYNGTRFQVTASLGVAQADRDMSTTDELLHAADEALYASKRSGRNRATAASACAKIGYNTALPNSPVPSDCPPNHTAQPIAAT